MSRWNALVLFSREHAFTEPGLANITAFHTAIGALDGHKILRSGRLLRFFGEPVRRFFWGRGRYSLDDTDTGFEHITQDDLYEMLCETTHAALVECHS